MSKQITDERKRRLSSLGCQIGMDKTDVKLFVEVMERFHPIGVSFKQATEMSIAVVALKGIWHCFDSSTKNNILE